MISSIEGQLVTVRDGSAQVRCGPVTYAVLVPATEEQELASRVGETVTLFTLHHLESHNQGTTLVPRLIGFGREADRAFFELFTTVKGVGRRKALRALSLPFETVATAIATRDLDTLKSLPEIGKRTAETIVAELHGKVDRFVEVKPAPLDAAAGGPDGRAALVRDAVAMLGQLGEPATRARQLVDLVLRTDPAIDTPDGLVAAAYRLRDTS